MPFPFLLISTFSSTLAALRPCADSACVSHPSCRLADESASFLRGLELQVNTPLVHRCQSLDLGPSLAAAGAEVSRASSSGSGEVGVYSLLS